MKIERNPFVDIVLEVSSRPVEIAQELPHRHPDCRNSIDVCKPVFEKALHHVLEALFPGELHLIVHEAYCASNSRAGFERCWKRGMPCALWSIQSKQQESVIPQGSLIRRMFSPPITREKVVHHFWATMTQCAPGTPPEFKYEFRVYLADPGKVTGRCMKFYCSRDDMHSIQRPLYDTIAKIIRGDCEMYDHSPCDYSND